MGKGEREGQSVYILPCNQFKLCFCEALESFFFFADSFDPELIKSIVAKLLYINEILKTSCVQFARLCQCSKDCTHVRSLYYMPEATSRSGQQESLEKLNVSHFPNVFTNDWHMRSVSTLLGTHRVHCEQSGHILQINIQHAE